MAVESSGLFTEGVRQVFTAPVQALLGLGRLTFAHRQDVRGRGVERHGSAVASVLQFRVETEAGPRVILVFLDEGLAADHDVVMR